MEFLFFFLSHNVNYVNFDSLKMKPRASYSKKKSIPFSMITTKDKSVCPRDGFVHMSCKCPLPLRRFLHGLPCSASFGCDEVCHQIGVTLFFSMNAQEAF